MFYLFFKFQMALYVEDVDFVDSKMDDKDYKAGKFAHSLRKQIFGEHLGLLDLTGQPDPAAKIDITDPVCDELYNFIRTSAKMNTRIYENVR